MGTVIHLSPGHPSGWGFSFFVCAVFVRCRGRSSIAAQTCAQLDYFTDKLNARAFAVTDPDLIRFVEAQVSVRHRTFGASSHPGATVFLLRIEGGSARFFSWFSAMASLAPTNAHLNCEGVSLAPANWRHARSGLSGRFEPMELGVFEAELTPVDGE